MSKLMMVCAVVACVGAAAGVTSARAERNDRKLVVTMTNDADSNQIKVYDADTHVLLQTLSTRGKGGVSGNARGIRQHGGAIVAVVNNGSNSVALFRRRGDSLAFDRVVPTTSAPVSVDFGNDHMYVAGATTVDSFALHDDTVEFLDGTASLVLAGGGIPPIGSTAQVGVIDDGRLLVTLKADPDPGTVDVVSLQEGRIAGAPVIPVSAPAGTLTPFGFATYPDGTALITLAHSNHDGLFRDGAFTSVIDAGQAASCWMTRAGKYVFVANTGSRTISRLLGTGEHIFIDALVAATITSGGAPSDIDASAGVLGVIDHAGPESHLSLFTYDRFGALTAAGTPIVVGVANANGVAVLATTQREGQ